MADSIESLDEQIKILMKKRDELIEKQKLTETKEEFKADQELPGDAENCIRHIISILDQCIAAANKKHFSDDAKLAWRRTDIEDNRYGGLEIELGAHYDGKRVTSSVNVTISQDQIYNSRVFPDRVCVVLNDSKVYVDYDSDDESTEKKKTSKQLTVKKFTEEIDKCIEYSMVKYYRNFIMKTKCVIKGCNESLIFFGGKAEDYSTGKMFGDNAVCDEHAK